VISPSGNLRGASRNEEVGKMEYHNIGGGRALRIAIEFMILGSLLLAGSADAKTLTVNASGGADYTRIQDAINNSNNGDTILVYSGTYFENVNMSKQLVLKGVDTGEGKPVVDASGSGDAVTLSSGNSILDGFTVTNGATIGIIVTSDYNNLSNNSAINNTEDGIVLKNASNNTLNNNSASSNIIFGIALLDESNRNTVIGNNALNNENAGIFLRDSNSNTLNNNSAKLNNVQGIDLLASIKNILINNTVSNSSYGIYLESSSDNNVLDGNTVSMNGVNGIFLTGSSDNTIYNNYFNNTNNFGVSRSNTWNTTKTSGTNIIHGPNIGGNYWANPNGTGFSQKCLDADNDGICDSPYMLDSNNTDYLPLKQDILSYYRSLGKNPNVVETTDLLKAADDWSNNRTVDGFTSPITTQQLLMLADEWSRS
jgi:nitrous oxidase accessory protein